MSYLILFITIICIIGSALWTSWSVILLDYIATPYGEVSIFMSGWFLFPQIFAIIFGTDIGTKLFFALILMASAYLWVLFAREISREFHFKNQQILEIFWWFFFLLNPFAYERMIVQPVIYLGIICLGYVMFFLFFKKNWKKYIYAWVFAWIAFNLFLHASYMIAIIFGLYLIFFVRSWRELGSVALGGIVAMMMNLNWILAPFFGYTNSVSTISSFSLANLEAFRTQALAPLDVWSTNILLYGFWGERYSNHYVNVGFLSSLWYVAGFLFFVLVGFGIYMLYKSKKKIAYILLLIWFLSLIFGIGIASSVTSGLTNWMIENVPLWQGYREPQKWIGLLMIVEGIGFLIWLGYILDRWGKDWVMRVSAIIVTTFLFLIWSPGPLLGYHGQLRTTVYPESFEVFRSEMIPSFSGRILALPWHSYIWCKWISRSVVANPITGLLAPLPVVSSDNIEVGSILYSNSQTGQSRDIEKFVWGGDVSLLRTHGFTHIFLMRSCASSPKMEDILNQGVQSGALIQEKIDDAYIFYRIQ